MKGARAMLVDRASAINGRHWEQDRNYVIGLPKDHSNLVKFYERDNCYDRVRQYLERFTSEAEAAIQSRTVPTEYSGRYNKSKLHILGRIALVGLARFFNQSFQLKGVP
jgi:hypothetical protein